MEPSCRGKQLTVLPVEPIPTAFMRQISLVPDPEQGFRLYYLIPVAYLYLFTLSNNHLFFWCSLIGLVGAATRHSSEEAVWGPRFSEKREVDQETQIKRTGTLIFGDKPPHEYSAESYEELWKEGEFQSYSQMVILSILLLFQGSLIPLYIYVFYAYFTNWASVDFFGSLILFALLTFSVYLFLSNLWPDASLLHYEERLDSEFSDIIEGLVKNLYADGITVEEGNYEPAEAGALNMKLSVEYSYGPKIRRDVNRVSFSACSLVSRSDYPISVIAVLIETEDGGSTSFTIESDWCRKLSEGEISTQEFARKVQNGAILSPP